MLSRNLTEPFLDWGNLAINFAAVQDEASHCRDWRHRPGDDQQNKRKAFN